MLVFKQKSDGFNVLKKEGDPVSLFNIKTPRHGHEYQSYGCGTFMPCTAKEHRQIAAKLDELNANKADEVVK